MKNVGFEISIFFRKIFHDFHNSFIKSPIYKIKKHKFLEFVDKYR